MNPENGLGICRMFVGRVEDGETGLKGNGKLFVLTLTLADAAGDPATETYVQECHPEWFLAARLVVAQKSTPNLT